MNTIEHLLMVLAEEAAEIIKEVSKSNRFGLDDQNATLIRENPNTPSNRNLLAEEIDDFAGVVEQLRALRVLPPSDPGRVARKKLKLDQWMKYAREKGTLATNAEACVAADAIENLYEPTRGKVCTCTELDTCETCVAFDKVRIQSAIVIEKVFDPNAANKR